MESYLGMRERDNRILEGMARMWGAAPKEDGPRLGQNRKKKDIVAAPIKAQGGEKFGVGTGLGYTELT